MKFTIAMLVLIAALAAGMLIAPRAFSAVTLSTDPCVLESGNRGVINPDCADVGHGMRSRSKTTQMWAGDMRHSIFACSDHPIL
jgi:hypothetical protein